MASDFDSSQSPSMDVHERAYFMLSLLIDGPCALVNNIDVYLQPLIDELKELWRLRVPTYDSYSKKMFQMSIALTWTINDFPAHVIFLDGAQKVEKYAFVG